MASAGTQGTLTVEDQSSYIKIETLHGKDLTEIRSSLLEVCGEQTMERRTVSHQATCFCHCHVSINEGQEVQKPRKQVGQQRIIMTAKIGQKLHQNQTDSSGMDHLHNNEYLLEKYNNGKL